MKKFSRKKALKVEAGETVRIIESGNRMIIPLACGEPETILEAMIEDKDR